MALLQLHDPTQLPRFVTVKGDMERPGVPVAGVSPGCRFNRSDEIRVERTGPEVQFQQLRFTEIEFTDRGQHSRRDPGRPSAWFFAINHRHRGAAAGQLPGCGKADQAGPDHDHVTSSDFLRLASSRPAGALALSLSHGITRIRFRRSVASPPPSQPRHSGSRRYS